MGAATAAAAVLGIAMLIAGGGKLASPSWPEHARGLGAPAWSVPVVPWIEIGLGALLVVQWMRVLVAALTAALLLVFTALLVLRLAQGRRPPCACFGGLSTRPIGPWSVARNVALVLLAVTAMVL
ncbi:MAG: MauE/DoxX family redox-associated membrane protein [Acidimicrobiia bacterium]